MSLKAFARAIVPHPIWERLRQARIRHHIRHFEPFIAQRTYAGSPLRVRIADGLGQGWYDHDWELPREIDLLSQGKLRPGARVFDCGAHQGVVALMLRQRVVPGGAIVAVEGMAHNCAIATENSRLNGAAEEITVVHAAIAAEPGRVKFSEGLNGRVAADGIGVLVDAITIDQLSVRFGAPQVLFIDVEGFECNALRGAVRTLREHAPDCYVEVHVGKGLESAGGSVAEVLSAFDPTRYELWVWPANDQNTPPAHSSECSPALMQSMFYLVALNRQRPTE